MRPLLMRQTPFGKRVMPVDQAELDGMLAKGTATQLHTNLYTENLITACVEPEEYETKVMTAGKRRKVAQDATA